MVSVVEDVVADETTTASSKRGQGRGRRTRKQYTSKEEITTEE